MAVPFLAAFISSAKHCAVEAWLAFLGYRWTALILYHLSLSDLRVEELRERLPAIAAKVLTESLGELRRVDLFEHMPDDVTCAMTDLARTHAIPAFSLGPVAGLAGSPRPLLPP